MIILKSKAALLYLQAAKQMAREENKTHFQLFGRIAAVTSVTTVLTPTETPQKTNHCKLCVRVNVRETGLINQHDIL